MGRIRFRGRDRIEHGDAGETLAVELLRRCGVRVVERNFRCRQGEIDLVCLDGDTLVFVEVRRRSSDRYGTGIQAVTDAKTAQVARVAEAYLSARQPKASRCRFDVVGITADHVQWLPDAFRAD